MTFWKRLLLGMIHWGEKIPIHNLLKRSILLIGEKSIKDIREVNFRSVSLKWKMSNKKHSEERVPFGHDSLKWKILIKDILKRSIFCVSFSEVKHPIQTFWTETSFKYISLRWNIPGKNILSRKYFLLDFWGENLYKQQSVKQYLYSSFLWGEKSLFKSILRKLSLGRFLWVE